MNAVDIVGWAFQADIYCTGCKPKDAIQEGHPCIPDDGCTDCTPHPVFAGDEDVEKMSCGECFGKLLF